MWLLWYDKWKKNIQCIEGYSILKQYRAWRRWIHLNFLHCVGTTYIIRNKHTIILQNVLRLIDVLKNLQFHNTNIWERSNFGEKGSRYRSTNSRGRKLFSHKRLNKCRKFKSGNVFTCSRIVFWTQTGCSNMIYEKYCLMTTWHFKHFIVPWSARGVIQDVFIYSSLVLNHYLVQLIAELKENLDFGVVLK